MPKSGRPGAGSKGRRGGRPQRNPLAIPTPATSGQEPRRARPWAASLGPPLRVRSVLRLAVSRVRRRVRPARALTPRTVVASGVGPTEPARSIRLKPTSAAASTTLAGVSARKARRKTNDRSTDGHPERSDEGPAQPSGRSRRLRRPKAGATGPDDPWWRPPGRRADRGAFDANGRDPDRRSRS